MRGRILVRRITILASVLALGGAAGAQLPRKGAGGAVGPLGRPGGAPTAATTSTTAAASSPRIRELRCRGGAGAFDTRVTETPSPRRRDYVTMRLAYRRSAPPPNGDWASISPGTCSWNDPSGPREPGVVFFDTSPNAQLSQSRHGSAVDTSLDAGATYPDAHSIPRYLTDPRHYWTFYVPESGPQVAISHGAWNAAVRLAASSASEGLPTTSRSAHTALGRRRAGDGALPPSRETPTPLGASRADDPSGRQTRVDFVAGWEMGAVRVTPRLDLVELSFRGGPGANPVVHVSTKEPIREPSTGRLFFLEPTPLLVTRTRSGSAWEYRARPTGPLERGTVYYYIAEASRADGATRQQSVGKFRTWTQYARVVFEKIEIRNDGDNGVALDGNDDGEIRFTFYAGVGDRAAVTKELEERDYSTGERVTLTPSFGTLAVDGAPDRLRIVVQAFENDDRGTFEGVYQASDERLYDAAASAAGNTNYARGEFDLGAVRGTSGRIPFTLRSALNGNDVSFDVIGHIEIARRP